MEKRNMKNRWVKSAGVLYAAALCFAVFSGCGSEKTEVPRKELISGYTEAQMLVIASSEKNRYEDILTEGIWDAAGGTGEGGLMENLEQEIQAFMGELKVVSYIAKDQGITLTDTEEKAMAGAAEEYYNSLSQSDKEAMGLTQEEILELYREYCLAQKFAGGLARQDDLEVSDSEAKVIHVLQASTENRDAAVRLREMASGENANFRNCAAELGIPVRELAPGRGQAFDEDSRKLEEAEFALAAGQVSDIIEIGTAFYVIYCENDYDEEATRERKERISAARVENAFRRIYEAYGERVEVTEDAGAYDRLNLQTLALADKSDFFRVYSKYKLQ